jgi:Uma2 family endonuclease
MALELKRRLFTVAEYHQMAEAGILGEDDRVELIEGEIVEMTPIGARHAECVDRLTDLFFRVFGGVARVRVQNPVGLGEHSEPQPDVALVRRKPGFYTSGHPTPGDVLLLVEVADSSADPDRRVKVPLYARSGIQEVWLVDPEPETITMYRDPTPEGFRTAQIVRRGETLSPLAFPEHSISVASVLPE